ncbi:hypothetical protein GQ44DRAFT_680669 [Phaeosphaeriaceae sp. PMI808]|nr:hypothetical protein GQ44DRAFT_680669 [Phaeosphaeriaceae sp. PMI808]
MAFAAVETAMNHDANQSLHPFFTKPLRNHVSVEHAPNNESPKNDLHDGLDYEHSPTSAQPVKAHSKRQRNHEAADEDGNRNYDVNNQSSLHLFTPRVQAEQVAETATGGFIEEGSSHDRKKRRKTESPGPVDASVMTISSLDWHQQLQAEAQLPVPDHATNTPAGHINLNTEPLLRPVSPIPTAILSESIKSAEELNTVEHGQNNAAPKKQIKITKTGKLVSSPPKHTPEEPILPKKRRGRKSTQIKISPTITIIKYGSDSASRHTIGGRIEAIMSGRKSTSKQIAAPKKGPTKPPKPSKFTHPFFLGKAVPKVDETPAIPNADQYLPTPRKSAVTPGKLRAETRRDRSPEIIATFGMPLGSSRPTKQSGLSEAPWPTRETAHVRNLGDGMAHLTGHHSVPNLAVRARKLKNRVITLRDDEELISKLAKDFATVILRQNQGMNSGFATSKDVRLPTRLLTTGIEIQHKVYEHLQARPAWSSEHPQSHENVHPAITTLFTDIEHILTPFDEGRCETQIWTQKYSPKCASHVLHEGKEATVLRDWLQSLKVMAVGGAQSTLKPDTADGKRPPRKKRKKEVDDFIVSDDDEDDEEMIEIPGREDTLHAKSFRRPHWTRNNNVILISGPHGCGKSATVYAVAKELDFEVFEINSGTRRSGKDIQDKVGDMTANHLVNHKRAEAPTEEETAQSNDTDSEHISRALQEDIDSGRQGTMKAFFQAKCTVKAKPKPEMMSVPKETKSVSKSAIQTSTSKLATSHKSQKQSLILLEEADVLYDEDQQFWAQITKLAAQSKRPIVITCNNERQIPTQDLPLAAILRLHPSSVDLATDYMLALAGREGHILERRAVIDLYKSKNHDLRASITELNFWCQMSVGDRKGGLEWMYQRWPPGKDIDANGRLLRVASESTYQSGMGWLSHDVFETEQNAIFTKEEELLKEVWLDWGINPTDWAAQGFHLSDSIASDQTNSLERLDAFTESLSAADVYSRVGLPSYEWDNNEPVDATQPSMTEKARFDYTLDTPPLEATQRSDFSRFDTAIYTQTSLLAHYAFPEFSKLATKPTHDKRFTEADYAETILSIRQAKQTEKKLTRLNFSAAFDIISDPLDYTLTDRTSFNLTPSSFDRTFKIITLDLAPYVRSIVAHEQILEAQRIRLSNLLSGCGNGKRARTTRASRVAMEGGVRETKRRERWFDKDLNFGLVMATAGEDWQGMGWRGEGEIGEGTGSATEPQESLTGSQDIMMQGAGEE